MKCSAIYNCRPSTVKFLNKRNFYRFFLLPFENWNYVRKPAVFEQVSPIDPLKLLVIICAFNDAKLLDLHRAALAKYLQDPFQYLVVDNSNKDPEAVKIKEYCLANGINYVRLPKNPAWGGISHGLALNWTYRNMVRKLRPKAFGFWDYDLFPIRPISIASYLSVSDSWGMAIDRNPYLRPWRYPLYLWVGLSFFRTEKFKNKTPDFTPDFGVDTGGRIPLPVDVRKKISDLPLFSDGKPLEIAPNISVAKYDQFVHFLGSSQTPSESLNIKKRWMEDILKNEINFMEQH